MRILFKGLASVLIFAISASSLPARLMSLIEPDGLAEKATLICNGQVESISNDSTVPSTAGDSNAVSYLIAKIKVLHVVKGHAPSEIEVRYLSGSMALMDGPIQIHLVEGERYRFFLREGKTQPFFVGVLDGLLDDGFAVEPLVLNEPDDVGYILKAEAIEIAKKWLKDTHPELPPLVDNPRQRPVDSKPILPPTNLTYNLPPSTTPQPVLMIGSCSYFDGKWTVMVMIKNATGAITENKQIIVRNDRNVDPRSWSKWP